MTEEEKFVIKMLKDSQNTYIENTKVERVALSTDEVKVILNLIDKLEIENSVLKQVRTNLINRIEMKKAERHSLLQRYDKSKEQITSLEKEIDVLANGIRVLGTNPDITTEEIIKEFTEKPISEEYMKKFESSYISKDKIRDKIKEYDKKLDKLAEKEHNWNKMNEIQQMEHQLLKNRYTNYHNVLNELLEEK